MRDWAVSWVHAAGLVVHGLAAGHVREPRRSTPPGTPATAHQPASRPGRARRARFFLLLPAFALLLGALFPFAAAYAQETTLLTGLAINDGTDDLSFKPNAFRGSDFGLYAVFVDPDIRSVNVTPTWAGSGASFEMHAIDATGAQGEIGSETWSGTESGDPKSLPLRSGYGATLLRGVFTSSESPPKTYEYKVYVYHHTSSADPPPPPEVSIAAGSGVTEGAAATFTLTASPAPAAALTVEVTVTQSGSYAAAGQAGTRQVTVSTSGTATLTVATEDDGVDEPDGSVTAAVAEGTGYTVSSSQGTATVAVADNDDPPRTQSDPPADPPPGGGAGGGGGGGGPTQSSDASLSGLQISDGTLESNLSRTGTGRSGSLSAVGSEQRITPAFESGRTSYKVAVEHTVESVMVTPTVNHAGATVVVNGTAVESGTASGAIPLSVGENPIEVVVTAEDGTTRTYRVTATRGTRVLGADEKAVVDKVGKALLGLPE